MISNIVNSNIEKSTPIAVNGVNTSIHKEVITTIKVPQVNKSETKNNYTSEHDKERYSRNFSPLINDINSQLIKKDLQLNYSKDKETGKTIMQLKDVNTNEIIRQLPTKEMLAVAKGIKDFLDSYDNRGNKESIVKMFSLINTKA